MILMFASKYGPFFDENSVIKFEFSRKMVYFEPHLDSNIELLSDIKIESFWGKNYHPEISKFRLHHKNGVFKSK